MIINIIKMRIFVIACLLTISSGLPAKYGMPCSEDSGCLTGGYEYCSIKEGEEMGKCSRKAVFPMHQQEFWGMIMILLMLFYANVGGVAGGGVVVPIAFGMLMLDAKNAIVISNASICISAMVRYMINARKPHPQKNGKGILVDMNLSVLMLPTIISGVSLGVIFNI
jgi:hypothetical protein